MLSKFAEKYLEGLLVAYDEEPPRIHALPKLLRRAIMHAPELNTPDMEDAVNALDQFYITVGIRQTSAARKPHNHRGNKGSYGMG